MKIHNRIMGRTKSLNHPYGDEFLLNTVGRGDYEVLGDDGSATVLLVPAASVSTLGSPVFGFIH